MYQCIICGIRRESEINHMYKSIKKKGKISKLNRRGKKVEMHTGQSEDVISMHMN